MRWFSLCADMVNEVHGEAVGLSDLVLGRGDVAGHALEPPLLLRRRVHQVPQLQHGAHEILQLPKRDTGWLQQETTEAA